jgi:hypothetical protein
VDSLSDATEPPAGNENPGPNPNPGVVFWNWFYASFFHPERITHFLTALATVALVVFAWRAWAEAQKTTTAIQGQLDTMKADQRPLVWVTFNSPPQYNDDTGQVSWNWGYNNVGKGIAYNVVFMSYIKIGNEAFQKARSYNVNNSIELTPSEPVDLPPFGALQPYSTIYSRPGIGKDYFTKLLNTDKGMGFLVKFHYTDASGTNSFDNATCSERLSNGAFTITPPNACPVER